MTMTLESLSPLCQERVVALFESYVLEQNMPSAELVQAMQYSVFNGGKRIRPLLVYAVGLTFDAPFEKMDAAACAVELIHTYSLIHDDLPAMDNADLRRGKPSCHKVFGEAMAILAGDALQPIAFQILTQDSSLTAEQKINAITVLSEACGPVGMAGGQALDMSATHQTLSEEALLELYDLKTGALLSACTKLGLISAGIDDQKTMTSMSEFARSLGLAFQLQDDLLDVLGTTEKIGKPSGLDAANNKFTYATLCGVEKTQEQIQLLTQQALQAIEFLENKAELLVAFAHFLLKRKD